MDQFFRRFVHEERAADMVEYALVTAIVAIASIAGFTSVAGALANKLNFITTQIQNVQ